MTTTLVISDLHLGPNDRMRIFHAGAALTRFIRHAASRPDDEAVELVILGDGIDYLQIEPYLDFSAGVAERKTHAVVEANREVFSALADFVQRPKACLSWVIGNHDVELLFPEARAVLEAAIRPPPGALVWYLDDTPLERTLPDGTLARLVHGHAHDIWNRVDYARAGAIARGELDAPFVYPHGSILVADVLNPLKREGLHFLDLLKPEKIAVRLALALAPGATIGRLRSAFGPLRGYAADKIREGIRRRFKGEVTHFKPGADDDVDMDAADDPDEALGEALADLVGAGPGAPQQLERWLTDPDAPLEVLDDDLAEALDPSGPATFSPGARRVVSWLLGLEAARASTQSAPCFGLQDDDELYPPVRAALCAHRPALVIAGHTHLARAVHFDSEAEQGWYLNTGTWADLMRIPRDVDGQLPAVAHRLRQLAESPQGASDLLRPFRRLTYVELSAPATGRWSAALRQWPEGDAVTLQQIGTPGALDGRAA